MRYTLEEWRDTAQVFYDITPLDDLCFFAAEAHLQRQGRLICIDARFSAQRFDHVPSRIKGVDHGYLLYERYLAGSARGLAADAPTRIDQSRIHLVDMSRTYRSVSSNVVTAGICIPHDLIGYDPSRDPPYRSLPLDTPQGRMLDLAHEALRAAIAGNSGDADALAAAFLALVRTLMLGVPEGRADPHGDCRSGALLRTYVTRHLGDLELTPEQICRELGVSRSVLYRAFQRDGGVVRYIADRRLDHCFADLAAAPSARGIVRTVAERWGFFHPGNFHRSFRDRFGVSPSDCLGHEALSSLPAPGRARHPVHEWLRVDPD